MTMTESWDQAVNGSPQQQTSFCRALVLGSLTPQPCFDPNSCNPPQGEWQEISHGGPATVLRKKWNISRKLIPRRQPGARTKPWWSQLRQNWTNLQKSWLYPPVLVWRLVGVDHQPGHENQVTEDPHRLATHWTDHWLLAVTRQLLTN